MIIIDKPISKKDLFRQTICLINEEMTKGVVDIEQGIIAVDAPLHADLEQELLINGSKQQFLWGINLYQDEEGEDFIEFDSMINLRPSQNNRSRGVDDPEIRQKIINIINQKIK